jgi:hypothetical protein
MNTATMVEQSIDTLELVEPQHHAIAVPQAQAPALRSTGAVTPSDLLRIAMDRNDGDLDRLERLMAMQERYEQAQERERTRQALLAFRRDFAAFRGHNIVVPLTKHVDRGRAGSFDQAEYHVIATMLSEALSQHGFSFRHDQRFTSRKWSDAGVESDVPWVFVTCYLEHRDGHQESLTLEGPPGDLSANTPTQNMQATASYLKRQSLLAITGTATGGEDDEAGMRGQGRREEAAAPPAAPALYDQAAFDSKLPAWTEALTKGRTTAERLIGFIESNGAPLTEAQKATLSSIKKA